MSNYVGRAWFLLFTRIRIDHCVTDEIRDVLVLLDFSERQILWSLCSVDFHTFILQLPIQTLHSVAPEFQVFVSSLENCQNFSKTSTPLVLHDKHILSDLRYKMQFFGIITI